MKYLKYFKESKTENKWLINNEPFNGGLQLFHGDLFCREFSKDEIIRVQINSFDKDINGGIDFYIDCGIEYPSLYIGEDLKNITDDIEYDEDEDDYSIKISEDVLNIFLNKIFHFYECNKYFIEKIQPLFNMGDEFELLMHEFELLMQQLEIGVNEYHILKEPLIGYYNDIEDIEDIDKFIDVVEKIKNNEDFETIVSAKNIGLL